MLPRLILVFEMFSAIPYMVALLISIQAFALKILFWGFGIDFNNQDLFFLLIYKFLPFAPKLFFLFF